MKALPLLRAEDVEPHLSWRQVIDALEQGHRRARAEIDDVLLRQDDRSLLSRAAWIQGLGAGVKSMTIVPANRPPTPTVQGVFVLFDDATGTPITLIDGVLLTKWKTAADSLLGATLLARPDSRTLLIVGAGVVADSLIEAYGEVFPSIERVMIWNRTAAKAEALAARWADHRVDVVAVDDLPAAVADADIVATATMATTPVLRGEWLTPGTHVDLIGAYRPDMREADDVVLTRGELFVDARETTVHEIGELMQPIAAGVIDAADVRADLYDLCDGAPGRSGDAAITVFKNGGGAHLDLMTARVLHEAWSAASGRIEP